MPSFSFPGQGQLPDELVIFVPLALIAAIGVVLLAGGGNAVRARYFGAIGLLTLFISLFAAYATVQALSDLLVDHEDRAAANASGLPPELQSIFEGLGISDIFEELSGDESYTKSPNEDANYTAAMQSGMIAIAAGGLLFLNIRVRRQVWPGDSAANSPTAGVDAVTRFGAIFVASLTAAFAFATAGYNLYKIAAPGTAGAADEDVGRMEGVAELIAALFLLLAALAIVRGTVQRFQAPRKATTARKR